MSEPDRRVFMYRGKEAKLFNSPEDVPADEGWKDHPHEIEEAPAPSDTLKEQLEASVALKKKGKKAAETEEPSEPVSDGNSN